MTDRIPLDDLTSDQLDALYDERDAARERLDFHERSTLPDLHRRAESDAATIKRWRDRAEAAEAALERVRVWADGPCPTRPKGYEITGDRASGYVQAMDEIAQLLTGHGPIAALAPAQQPTTAEPPSHLPDGGNAEDCDVCRPEIDKTVLYPWICHGPQQQPTA